MRDIAGTRVATVGHHVSAPILHKPAPALGPGLLSMGFGAGRLADRKAFVKVPTYDFVGRSVGDRPVPVGVRSRFLHRPERRSPERSVRSRAVAVRPVADSRLTLAGDHTCRPSAGPRRSFAPCPSSPLDRLTFSRAPAFRTVASRTDGPARRKRHALTLL